MVQLQPSTPLTVIYPESDGQPMADNTKQFRWIVTIKENLELLFVDRGDVFVAGDLLWYPVQGNNTLCQAPDAMAVFGRPKGDRGSYKQWEEAGIAPQVVFEILSPSNRLGEMAKKFQFYQDYGVEEYYVYNPDTIDLSGWQRLDGILSVIEDIAGWTSPRLQIRFELTPNSLQIYRPDGERFLTYVELAALREVDRQRAEQEKQRAEQEKQRADEAILQLEAERERNQALIERLRQLGINPEPE
mgnify:CR=1 FL=1